MKERLKNAAVRFWTVSLKGNLVAQVIDVFTDDEQ